VKWAIDRTTSLWSLFIHLRATLSTYLSHPIFIPLLKHKLSFGLWLFFCVITQVRVIRDRHRSSLSGFQGPFAVHSSTLNERSLSHQNPSSIHTPNIIYWLRFSLSTLPRSSYLTNRRLAFKFHINAQHPTFQNNQRTFLTTTVYGNRINRYYRQRGYNEYKLELERL